MSEYNNGLEKQNKKYDTVNILYLNLSLLPSR